MAEIYSDTMTPIQAGAVAPHLNQGVRLKSASAVVTPGATQASGDIASMVRVPSNSIIKGGYLQCGPLFASAGTAVVDVGLYSGETVRDIDVLLDGVDIETGAARYDLFLDGTGVADVTDQNKFTWELAGLSEDPGGFIDIKVTFGTTLTATDGLKLVVEYTAN